MSRCCDNVWIYVKCTRMHFVWVTTNMYKYFVSYVSWLSWVMKCNSQELFIINVFLLKMTYSATALFMLTKACFNSCPSGQTRRGIQRKMPKYYSSQKFEENSTNFPAAHCFSWPIVLLDMNFSSCNSCLPIIWDNLAHFFERKIRSSGIFLQTC